MPKTLENTRENDVTFVKEGDEDIAVEEAQDEFAAHFNCERPPHVLLTTSYKATSVMYKFCADLMVRRPSPALPRDNLCLRALKNDKHHCTTCVAFVARSHPVPSPRGTCTCLAPQ